MGDSLSIAVVSDLHCTYNSKFDSTEANTYLLSNLMRMPTERNPVESLKKVISNENLTADLLLCPGDITDKTNTQGLITGWQHLEDLKKHFNARFLAATIGNHDVDSRHSYSIDPFNFIKSLSKNFPTSSEEANDKFWSKNYCIISDNDFDLLIFNSSYSHLDKDSCNQSNISQTTLSQIRDSLDALKKNGKIKLALCHHHPIKHSNITYQDNDSIDKGDDLIQILDKYGFPLVIHGHKHDPRVTKYNSITVFCAGSFSSIANLIDLGAENTFHLIEIDKASNEGTIRTWVYGPKYGWQQRTGTYFPCHTGFGADVNIQAYAAACIEYIGKHPETTIKYSDLLLEFPKLRHLIPAEQIKMSEILKENSIEFLPELPDLPRLVSKLYV